MTLHKHPATQRALAALAAALTLLAAGCSSLPTATELLDALAVFLRDEVAPRLDGGLRFKALVGDTPMGYLGAHRMALAAQQLEAGHLPLAQVAQSWQHVMPPKPGGVLAALQGAPTADVVWMAHTGLEGLADIAAIWRGDLVGKTVRVELWRTPRAQVPVEKPAQVAWLFQEWQVMENWVEAQHKVIAATADPVIMPTAHDKGVTIFNRLVERMARED